MLDILVYICYILRLARYTVSVAEKSLPIQVFILTRVSFPQFL